MRPSRPVLVAAFLGVLALTLASLPGPAVAGPEPPSSLATAYNTERKLARAVDGTLFAAITVNASGIPQARVVATSNGLAWTSLPPPTGTGQSSDRTSLAIDSRGRLHLVWTEYVSTDRQVFYARYAGGNWTTPEQLSHSIGYAGFPSLAVDAQDRAHVAWYGFDGTFYQIYYRRLDPSGWTAERALTNEAVDATNPAIALGPTGDIHIVWFRQTRNATYNEIAYLRVEGDSVAETRTVSQPGVSSADPSLVVTRTGALHIVWSAYVAGVQRLQHVLRDAAWSPVETFSPPNPGATHPSLALDGTSRVYALWEGLDGQIYEQVRDGGWSSPVALSTGGVNRYPSARWSQDHNPLCGSDAQIDVVWTHDDGGNTSLAYRSLPAPFPCAGEPAQGFPWAIVGLGILIAATVGVLATVVWVRRRWYPKPPTQRA